MNQSPRRYQFIMVILALGLFFIALSLFVSKPSSGPKSGMRLATLIRQTGKVEISRSGFSQRSKVDSRSDLSNFDSVETFEVGTADLIFENGYHVRIFENSLMTLERVNESDSYHVVIILKRGDLRIDQVGRAKELFISKNGQPIEASLYNDSDLHHTPTVFNSEEHGANSPGNSNELPSLSEEEISTTMNNNRTSFFKCYTHLVQKNPRTTGEATLTFTVENSGKPTLVNVSSQMNPPLSDDEFVRCLKEVVQRITFKSFSGPAVSTIFPLKFD